MATFETYYQQVDGNCRYCLPFDGYRVVQQTRSRHRRRLLALLHDARTDAPVPLHAELLLNQIHSTLREQIGITRHVA
jgi:hypothetical protein